LSTMLLGYTWGHTGYGAYLTTTKAIGRLGFVAIIGVLPLVAILARSAVRAVRGRRFTALGAFAPFLVGALGIACLRNYYGHHPWMAAPVFVVGMVFTLKLLTREQPPLPADAQPAPADTFKPVATSAFVLCSLVYAVGVSLMYRAHNSDFITVLRMLQDHTARSDTIVLVENTDTKLPMEAETIGVYGDRHITVVPNLQDIGTSALRGNAFVLSAAEMPELPKVARTEEMAIRSWPLVRLLSELYARRIAKRSAVEQHFKLGTTCYLYKLKQPAPSTQSPPHGI
jgi:hypothetical protein